MHLVLHHPNQKMQHHEHVNTKKCVVLRRMTLLGLILMTCYMCIFHFASSIKPTLLQGNAIVLSSTHGSTAITKRSSTIFIDPHPPHYRPLLSEFLLGSYDPPAAHDMDAVIIASRPDATLAANVHNLYHLQGFRRFVFVVDNATEACPTIFALVPQHGKEKKHYCMEHNSFYSPDQLQRLWNASGDFAKIHEGPPELVVRAGSKVKNPRMGWYLQQFSKLLVPQLVPDLSSQFLAIDGDIIPNRPLQYLHNKTIIVPQTSKSPEQWNGFVQLVFPDLERKKGNPQTNYVVGWMIFDQVIIQDMISQMDEQLNYHGYQGAFPFNILQYANEIIKGNNYFSEFYTYAMFALNYTNGINHMSKYFAEPLRNEGILKSCILHKKSYRKAQGQEDRPPWIIWEEHKHHRFQSCPDGENIFKFSTVGIWHDFNPPPWGGGNQFLLALRHSLNDFGLKVIGKNDPDNGAKRIQESSQVLLANAITFTGNTQVLDELKQENRLALVHRVDGPYYVARYFRNLNSTEPEPLPAEDKKTNEINQQYACATIFQSQWSIAAHFKIGLNLRNPVVVPNMVDQDIFYLPAKPRAKREGRKLRIVASSHSANIRKGFDTMMWMDENLDFERYEFHFMGAYPETFVPTRLKVIAANGSKAVADFLRTGDIYFAPSRLEPASNAVSEALACGLPVLYQGGSSHGEIVGKAGVSFETTGPGLLQALESLVENYDTHVNAIHVPTMDDIAARYLAVMRWCFYMKHLMLKTEISEEEAHER